jgi:hypothetical protein
MGHQTHPDAFPQCIRRVTWNLSYVVSVGYPGFRALVGHRCKPVCCLRMRIPVRVASAQLSSNASPLVRGGLDSPGSPYEAAATAVHLFQFRLFCVALLVHKDVVCHTATRTFVALGSRSHRSQDSSGDLEILEAVTWRVLDNPYDLTLAATKVRVCGGIVDSLCYKRSQPQWYWIHEGRCRLSLSSCVVDIFNEDGIVKLADAKQGIPCAGSSCMHSFIKFASIGLTCAMLCR